MFNCVYPVVLFVCVVTSIYSPIVLGQEFSVSEIKRVNLTGNELIKFEANPSEGFNYPFFVFVPDSIDKTTKNYLYVEPNNSGTASDDFDVHLERAKKLAQSSYPNRIAKRLGAPLLVPTFPRPRTGWQRYTHALDIDTLEIKDGILKRIDLQLIAMVDFAQRWLRANQIETHERIFMHGFSASAKFCNRFAYLHPKRVQAVAVGGVNGLPTLPITERNGHTLPFPIGIADIETITGAPFDKQAHQRVAQYIYMGAFDRNDTLPSRDAWSEKEAQIISEATHVKMMPDRWELSRAVYDKHLPHAQCVTYSGVSHTIKDEMLDDVVRFFKANSGDAYQAIEPHVYPFVEYRELEKVHMNGLFWKGDKGIPEFVAKGHREGIFLLGIKEWINDQRHGQLNDFADHAGFNFILRAQDQPDITITQENYGGNSSSGGGTFQAYYVNLKEDQLEMLATGIPYTLHPQNSSEKYKWIANENITLTRSIDYSPRVRQFLNLAVLPKVDLPADINGVVEFFNVTSFSLNIDGVSHDIDFRFQANFANIRMAPKSPIQAEGLTIMELLMIICHRTSCEYRIEGTTVLITPKD